jgi:Ser/Thr protein kinase RdoA (MazF antagonist)
MQDGLSPALMKEIAAQFAIDGKFITGSAFGSGHINDTYQLQFLQGGGQRRYVLQRINTAIFKQPELLMENILRITRHLRKKLEESGAADIERRYLQFLPTRSGRYFHNDNQGSCWRLCPLVERTHTCDIIESADQAFLTAASFARFQKTLVDLPGARLHETIPNFHNTASRFADFEQAVQHDSAGRAASCAAVVNFALERKTVAPVLVDLMRQGVIPDRVTHNDTKLNNILLDDETEEAICIIDLDTVMPGSSLYDFGDMVRSSSCTAAEDEADLSLVRIDLAMFAALVRGYLSVAKDFLNEVEISHLGFSGKLITFEQGIRFLGDYLNGDTY